MSGCYEDILYMPHPVSKVHPQMSLNDRAAQFAPFAALTGHHEAVREAGRYTEEEAELDESMLSELDEKLMMLRAAAKERPVISVVWFQPDDAKDGGSYQTKECSVKKIDDFEKILVLEDNTRISFEHIVELYGRIFDNY